MVDTYFPKNFGSCKLTIVVQHNIGRPTFGSSSYSAIVFEYEQPGAMVLDLNATDADNVSGLVCQEKRTDLNSSFFYLLFK